MARADTAVGTKKKVSTPQLTVANNRRVDNLEKERVHLAKRYAEEDKVTVSGSPFYQPHFGRNMPIILNGIAIHVPLDGHQYKIPTSYAQVFYERIAAVDSMNRQQSAASNVRDNAESYAGEKQLISLA